MTRQKKKKICVSEEFQITIALTLKKFRLTEEQKELEFPSSLSSEERAYIHRQSPGFGLKSKSRGKGSSRYVTVYKKEGSTIVQADAVFTLNPYSRQHTVSLLQKFPLSTREKQDLIPPTERDRLLGQEARDVNRTTGRLNSGIPQVPPPRGEADFSAFRQSLPIWQYKDSLINAICQNQVVLIVGETGCGKTTQVPQYILDYHHRVGQVCRIICTQPRRLAAIASAERIACERDEKIGQTVGYQIRLESRVSPKTLLTVCTNGVLLRTLMGGDASVATLTHIIVDEIHERDRFSDFLLIILRDLLPKFRNLKVILMSATVDTQHFVKYFGGCPVIEVHCGLYDVKTYFLEDVLRTTGYMSKAMQREKASGVRTQAQKHQLALWCSQNSTPAVSESETNAQSWKKEADKTVLSLESLDLEEKEDLDPQLAADMDEALKKAWMEGTNDAFTQILYLILTEKVPVDYQHSETSASALMVASGRGNLNAVEELLSLGANPSIRASNDWTALEWAEKHEQKEVAELLKANIVSSQLNVQSDTASKNEAGSEVSEADKELLDLYLRTVDTENVDLELILCLLHKLHSSSDEGAILVFLTGYDDIVALREKIISDDKQFSDSSRYILYTLHSSMQCSDQKRVFKSTPPGVRKIILATNIAETSITINDVVFVIDSGKVKEKSFDALTGVTTLKSEWISQASARQRRGRAGRCRPGVCFHMFSRARFSGLQPFQQPEILRMPIHELCLQAKLLTPPNVPIADFLARAPDPPAFMVTRSAVTLLKTIDALDSWEELTELGLHLLDLPVEPHLGKMVLYSVVLKCLDPVLTIVCALAYRDPFLLPARANLKHGAMFAKKDLAAKTYSDHMALLRAFQAWQKARTDGYEKSFCATHFISSATMEMIVGMRAQLLGQLRASGFVRARGGGDIRDLNSNSDNWAVVKAALCAGSYPNLIRVDRERQQLIAQKESKVRFHTRSVLHHIPGSAEEVTSSSNSPAVSSLPSDWLIYEEMTRSGRIAYAHCCTLVSPMTVGLFAGPARLPCDSILEPDHNRLDGVLEHSDSEVEEETDVQKAVIKLDDWISFKVDPECARLALHLRQKWHALFLRRMHAPSKPWSQVDEAVVQAVVAVLTAEEQELKIVQPSGIGQRPRPMVTDFCSPVASPQGPVSPGLNSSINNYHSNSGYANQVMRRGSLEMEFGSSPGENPSNYALSYSGSRNTATPPRRGHLEKGHSRGSDERSDSSSVRSVGSGSGSASISPCTSPSPAAKTSVQSAFHQRYYIIKASSLRAVDVSFSTGLWSFSPATERKVQWALRERKEVFLIFSVQGSGHFQGYAKLTGEMSSQRPAEFCGSNLGGCYRLEWCKRFNLPFQATRHLLNPWNENRKVQISRDGQELEPGVGESLCKMWETIPAPVVR